MTETRRSRTARFTSKVIDERTGQQFRLKIQGDTVRVYPLDEDFDFGTFARFYEFVCEHIDPQAEPVVES